MSQAQSDISIQPGSVSKKGGTRLKTHMRSASHNKVLNKLPSSSSYNSSGQLARPNLNRSKSTDGLMRPARSNLIKKNNRSLTKLTGLHPLTKSVSNHSSNSLKGAGHMTQLTGYSGGLKTSARKGRAILRLNDEDADNEQFEDLENEDESGVATENANKNRETFQTDQRSNSHQNLKQSVIQEKTTEETENSVYNTGPQEGADIKLGGEKENLVTNEYNNSSIAQSYQSSSDEIRTSNNLYSGSLLLSQSTGLIRKIENPTDPSVTGQRIGANAYAINDMIASTNRGDNIHGNDKISGISFKAEPIDKLAEPVTNTNPAIPNNSYQPNQTIFNNLQRTNSHYLSQRKQNQNKPQVPQQSTQDAKNQTIALSNNFSNFLNKNPLNSNNQEGPSSQTRTQQRLWLQRENSLMDMSNWDPEKLSNFSNLSLSNMMFAQNYNQSSSNLRDLISQSHTAGLSTVNSGGGASLPLPDGIQQDANSNSSNNINGLLFMIQNSNQNSIQSRTEYERLNREYLNVRRHLNPVGESIDRLEKLQMANSSSKLTKVRKANNNTHTSERDSKNNESFKESLPSFQKKDAENVNTVNKIWQDALLSSSSAALSVQSTPAIAPSPAQTDSSSQTRPINPRLSSFNQHQKLNNLRAPNTPTTRAVKLANTQSTSNLSNLQIRRQTDIDQSQFT